MQNQWRRNSSSRVFDHRRVYHRGRIRRHRRRLWVYAIPVLLALLIFWILNPWLNGWTREPVEARMRAVQAIEEARDTDAARWAPDSLQIAETALRTGIGAERMQAARLFFWRDFREVEDHYLAAAQLARRAAIAATLQRDGARFDANCALDLAKRVIGDAEQVASEMPFPRRERFLLQHARTLVNEAGVLFGSTDYPMAGELATRASVEAKEACRGVLPLAQRFIDQNQVNCWTRWIDETVRWSRANGRSAVIVYKEKNLVELYHDGRQIKQYAADMGRNSIYPKCQSGDAATPEGRYRIVSKNTASRYYKALLLDYPNSDDRARFREQQRKGEVPRYASLGSMIEIHGEGGRGQDWTLGCVALSNRDMNDLFSRAEVGTPVTIVGGNGRDGTFSDLARSLLRGSFAKAD